MCGCRLADITKVLKRIHPMEIPTPPKEDTDPQLRYAAQRLEFWNDYARSIESSAKWGSFYRRRLQEVYRTIVPPRLRVLELGCGQGDLLAALKPSAGVGVDFSPEMISKALRKYGSRPGLRFLLEDAHNFKSVEKFDVIILSDLINDLWDVQRVLERVKEHCQPRTRVVLNFYSRLWQLPLRMASLLGFTKVRPPLNWLTVEDETNLLYLCDFEVIRNWTEILWPLNTPVVASLSNRWLVKIPPFRYLALANLLVARPKPSAISPRELPLVSVIVPARNEAGNIPQIMKRVPEMGKGTEIIFIEGHSKDQTYEAIQNVIAENPNRMCKLFRQTGVGKGDAVRLGFSRASGDILMILDADLTVPPEDLPRFFEAIYTHKGEFVNGVRLVYPMEDRAMRFPNFIANKFFSLAFTWLLGQSIKDTLCGTKVISKHDYDLIAENRSHFGEFDPFGDYDLIFGAARLNMKMVDMPVRYRERTYGTTNIQRWRHGLLLFRMLLVAAGKIKFT